MAPSKRRQPTKEPKPAKSFTAVDVMPPPAGQNPVIDPTLAVQQGPALAAQQVPMYPQFQFGQMNPYAFNFNPPSATPAGVQSYPPGTPSAPVYQFPPGYTPMSHPWLFNPASYGLAGPAPPSATAPPAGTDQSPSTVGGAPLTAQSNAYNVDLSLLDDDIPAPVPATQDITAPVPATQAGLMPSACAVPEPAGAVPLPDGELETSDVTSQPAPSVTTSPTPLVDDHVDSVSQHGQKRPREDSMNSSPHPPPRNGPMHPVRSQSSTGLREWGRGARNWRLARKRPLLPEIVDNARATKCYSGWVHDLMSRLRAEAPAALASFHKDVSMTMTSLVRADRKAKVESIVEALRNKARAEAAEAKTAATEQKLALANERLEELERRLESLTVITEENELYPPEDEPEEDDEEEFSETEEPL
ncbi:hypothetical protein D9611_015076 [Ephemerocybe angulata]|uniref:Uncharacterized protein n=1 Tax=Ephemerocybe angulata TaxID=980116 RepID=A0A8H5F923_9AGAR|nr:hypothetical protein D9611_015076 [Tulosesus angulatus]